MVYNEKQTIAQIVERLICYSGHFNVEILIVDSESTDGTHHTIKQLQKKHRQIRYLRIKRKDFHYADTRNKAVLLAKGKYVLFISGDAIPMSKNLFHLFFEDLNKNNETVAVFGKHVPNSIAGIQDIETICKFEQLDSYTGPTGIFIQNRTLMSSSPKRNDTLFYFLSNVFSCYKRSFLLQHPFSRVAVKDKELKGKEDISLGKKIIEIGLSKIYDKRCVVKHSNNLNILQYYNRQKEEFGLMVTAFNMSLTHNILCKIKKISSINIPIVKKISLFLNLLLYYLIKIVIVLEYSLNNKKIIILILLQLLVIMFLGYGIFYKRNNILGIASVNPMRESLISSNNQSQYKYFYEPRPNTTGFDENGCGKNKNYFNNDTLNDHSEHGIHKDEQTFRIITLGDSFTEGICVDPDQSWPKQLEAQLNKKLDRTGRRYEIINLGAGGYDLEYSVERYRLRGQKYNPDVIIFFLKDDDFNSEADYVFSRINFHEKKVGKIYQNGDYNGEAYVQAVEDVKKYYMENQDRILKNKQKSLEELLTLFPRKVLIITFPFTSTKYKNLIHKTQVKYKNLLLFDGLTNIYRYGDEYVLKDTHPNEKGYQIIASDIFTFLTKNNIVPYK